MHWEEVRDKFRIWREDNSRHSEEVVDLWVNYLQSQKHKLGDEQWMVEEQVFIAGLDCGRLDVADQCFIALSKQFPGSVRVLKLKGMRLETLERHEDALTIYDAIIREDETNSTARKRKVAVLKSQGRIQEAIKELIEYLSKFMSDGEAWQELADFYIKEGDYGKAAYCMEELILQNPHNHLYYTRYAEIKYTQGGAENLELARNYFSMAIKLNPINIRAYYGLIVSCSSSITSSKLTSSKKKEIQKLSDWAQKKLTQRYEEEKSKSIKMDKLQESLNSLCITDKSCSS
ncbi:UNVERIFIED_CONTAM: hypothetical protein RMT77_007327 [Armadillidium vulgare]|uniref:ER membrane protein complex subunit 2 n=1 Tax=Armadillidium nasatum TaxID=96803 RepID=A0A5N5SYR3_9CRUS|nr:ER membrane protein complex subunit 2-B [Armadillidium nasatum]